MKAGPEVLDLEEYLSPFLAYLDRRDPGGVVGAFLYGSGATTGLRPDSDVDLLIVTSQTLDPTERRELVEVLLSTSGWQGHREMFPDAADRRPLEVTFLTLSDLATIAMRPRRDFQYGEWLRVFLTTGMLPEPTRDPDVVILVATALQSSLVLRGAPLSSLTLPIPQSVLRKAIIESVPGLLDETIGDERNVLLTLARMLVTAHTGAIVSKDEAAESVAATRTDAEKALLHLARDGYLGLATDDWCDRAPQVNALAHSLARELLHEEFSTPQHQS